MVVVDDDSGLVSQRCYKKPFFLKREREIGELKERERGRDMAEYMVEINHMET